MTAVRAVYDDALIGRIAATGSYVAAIPYLKAGYELLGLRAGPMRLPARATISHAERDRLAERLYAAGVL